MRSFPYAYKVQREIHSCPVGRERIEADLLEIGPGKGEFLLLQAAAHPALRLAAIEVSGERFTKLIRRVEAAGLRNVELFNGDARVVIPRLVADASLQRVVVLFPDPWPKRRHVFHRLMTREFLVLVIRSLRVGGDLLVKTDATLYAEAIMSNAIGLPGVSAVVDQSGNGSGWADIPSTFYERKQRAGGLAIHCLRLVRAGGFPGAITKTAPTIESR